MAKARDRGQTVHLITALHDRETLDPSSVDVDLEGFLEAWIECKKTLGIIPITRWIERTVWHPMRFFAGTLDRIVQIGGQLWIIDLKTGSLSPFGDLQTAAYEDAVKACNPEFREMDFNRACVVLKESGQFRVQPYTSASDIIRFYWYLNVSRENVKRGLRPLGAS